MASIGIREQDVIIGEITFTPARRKLSAKEEREMDKDFNFYADVKEAVSKKMDKHDIEEELMFRRNLQGGNLQVNVPFTVLAPAGQTAADVGLTET